VVDNSDELCCTLNYANVCLQHRGSYTTLNAFWGSKISLLWRWPTEWAVDKQKKTVDKWSVTVDELRATGTSLDGNASRTRYFAAGGTDGVEITRSQRVTTEIEGDSASGARYCKDEIPVWTVTLRGRAILLPAAQMEWK
jgi:hypothetical protein